MIKKALKVYQDKNLNLFVLTMNMSEIDSVCTISTIFRDSNYLLQGYQRTEIRNHVDNITNYIQSEHAIIPNSIIMGLSTQTKIKHIEDELYELNIPDGIKSAVLVDGQQRVAALKQSGRENFYFSVCVFIHDDVEFERQQFLLINSAKPLSRSLIYELLPHANGLFNSDLIRKKLPSLIVQLLNYEESSPLKGLVKLTTNPEGIIADNSLIKMVDNSLREGALYHFRGEAIRTYRQEDCQAVVYLLSEYFKAVRNVFNDEWGKKPKDSRLFHGVGIISLGQLFDEIYYSHNVRKIKVSFGEYSIDQLHKIKPYCCWSKGVWKLGKDEDGEEIERKWNQIQNITKDINLVTRYLIGVYDKLERGAYIESQKKKI